MNANNTYWIVDKDHVGLEIMPRRWNINGTWVIGFQGGMQNGKTTKVGATIGVDECSMSYNTKRFIACWTQEGKCICNKCTCQV